MKVIVLGASGYTGAELCNLLSRHPSMQLACAYVSENSNDSGKALSQLYPQFPGLDGVTLQPFSLADVHEMDGVSLAFLATPHEFSHDVAPALLDAGIRVADLSGAFRLKDAATFARFYGFNHLQREELALAEYGLVDFYADKITRASLVAVPGCYPTASLLALKPLAALLDTAVRPVINAISGVSGAGRKAALNTSFCEVGVQAYGVLGHRHQPEISAWLGQDVLFTPHLGTFKRGILATISVRLREEVNIADIQHAYQQAYVNSPLVRVSHGQMPRLDDVVNTPRCHIGWQFDPHSGYLVVSSAIDNLLKGAAAQALQNANLMLGLEKDCGL